MKSILIINLKKYGDIFYMAHTINSLKRKYPNSQISTLVFKESIQAAKLLKNINSIFSIDRKRVLSFLRKDIYNDSFSINDFSSTLNIINDKKWDVIFNHSNDTISSYITSFLTENNDRKFLGVKIGSFGNVEYSNHWAEIFNEFVVQNQQSPFPFAYCYAQMFSSFMRIDHDNFLLTNKKHDQVVEKHFSLLRDKRGKQKKIIGMIVSASTSKKSIPEKILFEVLDVLIKKEQIAPVIIHAPIEKEKNIAKALIRKLKENIVTIECDFVAAVSVIKKCDVIITPDTSLKYIADLVATPSIEVSLSDSSLFKQSTLYDESLILSAPIYERRFDASYSDNTISSHDIVVACNHILFRSGLSDLNDNVVVYRPMYDSFGPYLNIIYGRSNIFDEITRIMLKYFTVKLFSDQTVVLNYNDVFKYGYSHIRDWTKLHKSEIFRQIETILNIFSIIENFKDNEQEFLLNIDLLLQGSEQFSLVGFCLSLFRGRIENLYKVSVDDNFSYFKNDLRGLKKNLMAANSFIEEIESHFYKKQNVGKFLHGP